MIDEGMRRRRVVLAWVLLAIAALLAVCVVVFGRVLLEQAGMGVLRNSYALGLALVVTFLALAGAGGYLLRTVRGR